MNSSMFGYLPKLNRYDYYFIHIPKNGGTAFERYFMSRHYGHHFLQEYPQEIWHKTIAIIRNPLDRLVSTYNYSRMKKSYWHSDDGSTPYGPNPLYDYCHTNSFAQFIQDVCNGNLDDSIHLSAQYKFVVTPDNQIPTHLLRFEELSRDLTRLFGQNISLPLFNMTRYAMNAATYTDELRDMVYRKFKIDFLIHNYLLANDGGNMLPPNFVNDRIVQ